MCIVFIALVSLFIPAFLIITTTEVHAQGVVGSAIVPVAPASGTAEDTGVRDCEISLGGGKGDFSPTVCLAYVVNWVLSGAALVTWAGGIMLNYAVDETIINIDAYLGEGNQSITTAWELMRNIGNIVLIFGFLAVGIGTILNLGSFTIRRTLPLLIIAALLVNFSLFFTKAVIDVSNILALFAYEQVAEITPTCDDRSDACLSDAFMQALALPTVYNVKEDGTGEISGKLPEIWDMILIGFMGIVLFLITGFVFLAAAFMLLMRFVVLVFLLVLSPLALVAIAIPGLHGQWKKWLDKLIGHAFYAPIFFFLILIVIILIDEGRFFQFNNAFEVSTTVTGPSGEFQKTAYAKAITNPNEGTSAQTFIQFVIIIALVIGTLIIAKMMSIQGAGAVIKLGKQAQGWGQRRIGGATFGAAGWVGRNTVGRGASRAADSEALRRQMARGGIAGWAARSLKGGLDRTAKSSLDARRVGGLGKTLGIGEGGGKGGYQKKLEEQVKRREALFKEVGKTRMMEEERVGSQAAFDRMQEIAHRQTELKQEKKQRENEGRTLGLSNAAIEAATATQRAELARLETEYKQYEDQYKAIQTTVGERGKQRQRTYVNTLATRRVLGFKVSRKNKEASNKLRGSMLKGKKDKLFDAIKEATAEETPPAGGAGGGGGGTP